jgi:hypothetical protein
MENANNVSVYVHSDGDKLFCHLVNCFPVVKQLVWPGGTSLMGTKF